MIGQRTSGLHFATFGLPGFAGVESEEPFMCGSIERPGATPDLLAQTQ